MERFKKINTVIENFALGNFDSKLKVSKKLDEIDAFITGINMLGEELKAKTISRNYFKNVFDSISEMVFILNKNGQIIEINKAVKIYFVSANINLENSKNINELFPKNNTSLFEMLLEQLQKNKNYGNVEIEFISKTQKTNSLFFIITNLKSKSINNGKYIITAKDISAQKETKNIIVRTIVETQENERVRFSQDIHDSLGQQLSALKFYLGACKDLTAEKKIKDILIKANDAVIGIQSEMRNVCFNLMPKTLEIVGLIPTLKELCAQMNIETKMQFIISVAKGLPEISKAIEVAIFRIVQEFINNTLKYAKASKVFISIKHKTSEIIVMIRDNGIGFNLSNISQKGRGLRNIKYRAEAYKGKIKFASVIGEGTTFTLSIPITN